MCAEVAIVVPAQTFRTLLNFEGDNGAHPITSFVQGRDGMLYGTTTTGGANDGGTVFKITYSGGLTTLYNFCAQTDCTDGTNPNTRLVLGTNGIYYGTTTEGGDPACNTPFGCGTLFEITAKGTLNTLHIFEPGEGTNSMGGLLEATDGYLYGSASGGGADGYGTIFKSTREGVLTTLLSFDMTDGANPGSRLIQGTDGSLYGTSRSGGNGRGGTIYRMTEAGKFKTLHSFDSKDGVSPAGLIQATDGYLYGTTAAGGPGSCNCGTVFRISPTVGLATLHSFAGTPNDGTFPNSGLIQATDGNFYGTTVGGGANNLGTVFKITPEGTLTTLHSFETSDGLYPYGGLFQATNGIIYGTTYYGGDSGHYDGTVFSLDMGLAPFVTFVRAAGRVGQTGGILGQGFTGTTSVSLNGTPASFTVVSDTYIRATVPAGATTGYVTVTTPSGTLISNVPFHVIK